MGPVASKSWGLSPQARDDHFESKKDMHRTNDIPLDREAELEMTADRNVCPASPTGAHHWLIGAPGANMTGECKHCHRSREFRPFDEGLGFNNSPKKPRGSAVAEM
jgi:hypothetical protein